MKFFTLFSTSNYTKGNHKLQKNSTYTHSQFVVRYSRRGSAPYNSIAQFSQQGRLVAPAGARLGAFKKIGPFFSIWTLLSGRRFTTLPLFSACYESKCLQKFTYHRFLVYNPKDYYYPFKVSLAYRSSKMFRKSIFR